MSKTEPGLSPDQLRAIGAMSGAEAAELDAIDPERVSDWLNHDPGFVAGLNRARGYRQERLRAEIRSLSTRAVKTLRHLVSDSGVPPSVRLRASLAVLEMMEATKPVPIGPTSSRSVEASMDRQALIDSLGG